MIARKRLGLTVLAGFFSLGCSNAGEGEPTFEGQLQIFIVDHANGEHEVGYALKTDEGHYVELEFAERPAFESGDSLSVRGALTARKSERVATVGEEVLQVSSAELLQRAGSVASLEQPLASGEPQTVTAAVVLLNFTGVTAQSFSKANADQRLATVTAYYDEVSYGNWQLEGASFGPYTVAKPANCNLDTIGDLARQAASDNGVAIDDYDHVGVTLPSNGASGLNCACGLAFVGRTPAQPNPSVADTSLYTCTDANAFAHEMGHGFGLHHAATASCGGEHYQRDGYDNCSVEEYGNQFNTMGNGLGHFNAFQKSTMKWLDECNSVLVTTDGTFDVFPMQSATTAIQSLQIPNGETRDNNDLYYWVEYRNPELAEFNAMDGSDVRELGLGVHIDVAADHREDGGDRRPLLLDLADAPGSFDDPRLGSGKSFVDPDGRVTVQVLSATAEKAVIEVTFPGGGSGENLCVNGSTPPDDDGASGAGGDGGGESGGTGGTGGSGGGSAGASGAGTGGAISAGSGGVISAGSAGIPAAAGSAGSSAGLGGAVSGGSGGGSAGAAAPLGNAAATPKSEVEEGCACRAARPRSAGSPGVFAVLVALALGVRRRRQTFAR